MSFSNLWVNSTTLLDFRCISTLRANMTLSLLLDSKGVLQVTVGSSNHHEGFFGALTMLS
jgi:hypothetical protein